LFAARAFLSRVVNQDWNVDPRNFEIRDRFLANDPVIASTLTRLAREAHSGSPSGSLYAESACEFLAHHIIRFHSSLSPSAPLSAGGLPANRLNIVREFIEENIARPISLHQLATTAGVSPRHFERAFRQATGVPPYAYVLRRRVDAAREILINDPLARLAIRANRKQGKLTLLGAQVMCGIPRPPSTNCKCLLSTI
jgi:AraC family transcriptional regulator